MNRKRSVDGDYAWIVAGPVWVQFTDGKITGLAQNAIQTLDTDMRRWVVATVTAAQWTVRNRRDGVLDLKLSGFAVPLKQTWFEVGPDTIKDLFR